MEPYESYHTSRRRWAVSAAAVVASVIVAATASARPAAPDMSSDAIEPPRPTVTDSPAAAVSAEMPGPVSSLHGLPPEVFAARIETISAMLASR